MFHKISKINIQNGASYQDAAEGVFNIKDREPMNTWMKDGRLELSDFQERPSHQI